MVSKRLMLFCGLASFLFSVAPSSAEFRKDYLVNSCISPDTKYVACTLKATACADVLDPHVNSTEHQVVALFNVASRQWKILNQTEQINSQPSDFSHQYLGLSGFSPDSKYLATTDTRSEKNFFNQLIFGDWGLPTIRSTITLWDTETQKSLNSMSDVERPGALSAAGCILSLPPFQFPDVLHGARVQEKIGLWDVKTGKHQLDLTPITMQNPEGGEQYDSNPCSFSADGRLIAALVTISVGTTQTPAMSSWSHAVKIYDSQSGKCLKTIPISESCREAFSPNNKILVTSGKNLEAWDVDSGKRLWKKELQATGTSGREALRIAGNRVLVYFEPKLTVRMANGSLAESHDGNYTTQVVDLTTGKLVRDFGPEKDYTKEVMLSPDGKKIMTFSGKVAPPRIRVFDVDSAKLSSDIPCPMGELEEILERQK